MATQIFQFSKLPKVAAPHLGRLGSAPIKVPGDAPRVGVIYNPRSHGNRGADFDCDLSPHVHIAMPGDRSQLPEALAQFAAYEIDLLVINGGDGTVRDVLTSGAAIFGDRWPAVAVLPKGKTNALTHDLGVPIDWTLQQAIEALDSGTRVKRHPIKIAALNDKNSSDVLGFILGAGAFTTATQAGQSAHRLGAFNQLAVGVTALWAMFQALFGSRGNPWRRGSRMDIRLGSRGAQMEHSGNGDPAFRQLLFASTLENLPAGINPFGKLRNGLKLVALDQVSRITAAMIPLIVTGRIEKGLRQKGIHQVSVPEFTLSIDDPFIFDGEAFPSGEYRISQGPELQFVAP